MRSVFATWQVVIARLTLLAHTQELGRFFAFVSHWHAPPPSPSSLQPPLRNHLRSRAGNSAVRCVASCQARSRPRVMGTRAAVLFRILTGIFVLVLLLGPTASITSTSTSNISLSTRTTEPTHRRISGSSILRSRDHIFALVAEYLERFVEDRSKFGQLRTPRPS